MDCGDFPAVRLTNLNPDHDIGASSWLLEIDGQRLLLDAGVHPAREGTAGLPLLNCLDGRGPDAIAISHCHHDHVGALPLVFRKFPQARIYMTRPSYLLVERILHNSVNVMIRQRESNCATGLPLFSHDDVEDCAQAIEAVRYREEIPWGVRRKGANVPTMEFFNAGHTLGSSGVLVHGKSRTVFYSGDVCLHDQLLLTKAAFDDVRADVMIVETTRGATVTAPGFSREGELERLGNTIEEVLFGKGCVLIPAFGLGRTQEILAHLLSLMQCGRLRRQPVYVGGMGRALTDIYDDLRIRTHRQMRDVELTRELELVVMNPEDARMFSPGSGKLFVATAGMMSEGTLSFELAMRLMQESRHAVLLVGYCAADTPARRLLESNLSDPFEIAPGHGLVRRRCRVERFDLSSHAQREDMVALIRQVNPRRLVLGHGDSEAKFWFREQLKKLWPQLKVAIPGPGEIIDFCDLLEA